MPAGPAPSAATTQLLRALGAVQDMRTRLEALQSRSAEPIAIVGLACRFPGGENAAQWWQTLVSGADAITLVPPERWDREALFDADPDAPGKMSTRWGGFITDVDLFDAAFFGISPREAVSIDPQQRLLLELAWHALEDAGQAPDQLAGSRTGVYVGISTNDYARVAADQQGSEWIDAHSSTGNSVAVAAGRLSYCLGLQGPAMAIDTACSSSLVAVHQAVRALRSGEIGMALAAGVNLVLLPDLTIGFSKARMMAADGRCKTFDAAADGYVRGEGCGVVVLKRLSDALADGDTIHALVAGSAVNHDGRSNGLTAPNGPAQAAVIRAALADAGIEPGMVSCIEAHGTGTALGDPIEVRALASVYGAASGSAPLPMLASVKTQVGHLEAASGIAGLIKMTLALRARTIAPHLNFHTLNPDIAADGFPFQVPLAATAWEARDGRRLAAVSSFGFSGTNGHVIVEQAPAPGPAASAAAFQVLPLSARDPAALETLRASVAAALKAETLDFPAFAATLGMARTHHAQRLAIVAGNAGEASAALAAAGAVRSAEAPMVAFMFTGQGCQYPGMAAGLLAEPRFRATLALCDAALGDTLGRPITELIRATDTDFSRTDILQPVLFAIEYAVADLWRWRGVQPAAVIGHSLGEIAAACFTGAMELAPSLRFVAARGRLMQRCAGQGAMAAVLAPSARVAALLAGSGAVIAGYNSLTSCVIAADTRSFAAALTLLDNAQIAWQALDVVTGFHSSALDGCLDELEHAAAQMPMQAASLPVASNLTGACIHQFDAHYWRRQAREPVHFVQGLQTLAARGCTVFLEVGPHAVLSGLGRTVLPEARFVASLKRGADDSRSMAEALAELYRLGVPLDWKKVYPSGQRRAPAPQYPFQRARHWPAARRSGTPALSAPGAFPAIPGVRLATPLPQTLYEMMVSSATMPFLADHVVFGQVVVPGAMHAVTVLAALREGGHAMPLIEDLVFEQALVVPDEGVRAQLVLEPDGAFALSTLNGQGEWTRHAVGQGAGGSGSAPEALDLAGLRARMTPDGAGPAPLFRMLAERGIVLGPAFQGTVALWRGEGEALAEIRLPAGLRSQAADLPIHPAMLDACFQGLGATFSGAGADGGFLPLSVDRMQLWRSAPEHLFCHVRSGKAGASGQVAIGHFTLCDGAGEVVMQIDGLQIKRVEAPMAPNLGDAALALEWLQRDLGQCGWAEPGALVAAGAAALAAPAAGADGVLADGLEQLACAFAAQALRELDTGPGALPARARLLGRVTSLAALHHGEAGALELAGQLRLAHPGSASQIDLVERCGAGLAGVLRGQDDPLQLIFPDGSAQQDNIYGGAGLAHDANSMLAAALADALARRGDRPLRVLEVGAGTGATTALALPQVQQVPGAQYLFTDISPAFLMAAQERFGDSLDTALLDLEQPLERQHFTAGSFDVVIAANVVHATADVVASLTRLRQLLAPGGLLLMVESTHAQAWWDIVFGLTEGWWRFTDTVLRPDHPLLDSQAWQGALREAGFAHSASAGADAQGRLSLLAARAAPAEVLAVHDGMTGPARQLADELAAELALRQVPCTVLDAATALAHLALPDAPAAPFVVYTGAVGPAADHAARPALRQAFELVRALALSGCQGLYLVTRGAYGPSRVQASANASLWGLGKVAALEHPELHCRLLDLDPDDFGGAAHLANSILADDGDAAVAWRGGQRLACRLASANLPALAAPALDPDGTVLVVGAFGGLGPLLAAWLVEQGARHLVLVGRHPPSSELAAHLQGLGATVHLRCADAGDGLAMTALIEEIARDMAPLRSVFHLAGGVADGALLNQQWERFSSILGAKADGAHLLDALTRATPLQHFVLFSSSAALIGNPGQANHAAANACLDALAQQRQGHGLPALSINWGAWSGAGAVVEGDYAGRMAARGVLPIAPEEGLQALGRAMASGRAHLGLVGLDWPVFLAGYDGIVPPFLAQMAQKVRAQGPRTPRARAARGENVDLRALLDTVEPAQRLARLQAFITSEAAKVLGMGAGGQIDPAYPLNELGLDSLLALELRTRLGAAIGSKQPATLLFNYPSVGALTSLFAAELIGAAVAPIAPAAPAQDALRSSIASMSEAELEALINDELNGLLNL